AKVSFQGTMGQRVSLVLSNNTQGFTPYINIFGPDLSSQPGPAGPGLFTDPPLTLPQSGTYTILLQTIVPNLFGYTVSNGSVALAVSSVPPDITGTVSVNGPAFPVGITGIGQNAQITFNGTANQSV